MISSLSLLFDLLFKIPPNTFGCNVFTLPFKIDGYDVISSTLITFNFNAFKNDSVPPVE